MRFTTLARTSLVLVYLVIAAGALVRMTGSGMGCPDWPKCFGYYIPPTDIAQLTWAPQRSFESGQVIIRDEKLLVADGDFTTGNDFNAQQWRPYTKHDYAIFNPVHTWVEYVNRLFGALAGLAVLAMAIASWRFRRERIRITVLSWLTVVLMGTQAWLGARVVYSVLNPLKITLHMVVALLIVFVILYLIRTSKPNNEDLRRNLNPKVLWAGIIVLAVQIILGTQVREFVDEQMHGGTLASELFRNPTMLFYVHRSFSIAVLAVIGILFYGQMKNKNLSTQVVLLTALTVAEILLGAAMYTFAFPFGTQALHLVIAAVMFGLLTDLLLSNRRENAL